MLAEQREEIPSPCGILANRKLSLMDDQPGGSGGPHLPVCSHRSLGPRRQERGFQFQFWEELTVGEPQTRQSPSRCAHLQQEGVLVLPSNLEVVQVTTRGGVGVGVGGTGAGVGGGRCCQAA